MSFVECPMTNDKLSNSVDFILNRLSEAIPSLDICQSSFVI
jgi:hypothetical protein